MKRGNGLGFLFEAIRANFIHGEAVQKERDQNPNIVTAFQKPMGFCFKMGLTFNSENLKQISILNKRNKNYLVLYETVSQCDELI